LNKRHDRIEKYEITPWWKPRVSGVDFAMRYLVKARVKSGHARRLAEAIARGTLGRGSIAGDEYLHDMQTARLDAKGEAYWVETCFCDPPLAEERPYWEEYFELLSVKDAHSRRNCRHENGTESWACCDCDCTKRLEEKLARAGKPFLASLRAVAHSRSSRA
jgi:hypothetical protein